MKVAFKCSFYDGGRGVGGLLARVERTSTKACGNYGLIPSGNLCIRSAPISNPILVSSSLDKTGGEIYRE